MKHIVSQMSSCFPNRWPLIYLNLTKNMKTYIRRQQHNFFFKHQDIKQKEPPQKYRLGTISNTKLLACLNRFYRYLTSPSASVTIFPLKLFEKAVKIKWQDKIPDTEVLKKAGMQIIHIVLKVAKLRWTDHAIMPDERRPNKVFCGELQEGKCSQGSQKKRYKDTLKASLKDFNIPIGSWEQTAQERSKQQRSSSL